MSILTVCSDLYVNLHKRICNDSHVLRDIILAALLLINTICF
jgi:hypothetical protein